MIPYQNRDKLDFRTLKCNFIGYSEPFKGYVFYNKEKGLIESRDATLLENSKEREDIIEEQDPLSIIDDDHDTEELPHDNTIGENEPNSVIGVKRTRSRTTCMDG